MHEFSLFILSLIQSHLVRFSVSFFHVRLSWRAVCRTAEEDDQQDAEEVAGGDGSGDSDENLAKMAANVSDNLINW